MNENIYIKAGVTKVTGPDSRTFLHSLVSSDINMLENGQSQPSLLLNPVGKTLVTMWIYQKAEDEYLLISPLGNQETLIEQLKRFCIRTDAAIDSVTNDYIAGVYSDAKFNDELKVKKIEENHCSSSNVTLILIDREQIVDENIDENDNKKRYKNFRISYGAVSLEDDLGEDSIAQEASLDTRAISFDKGCFLGQELVCRIDSRSASTPYSFFSAEVDRNFLDKINIGSQVMSGEEVIGEVTSVFDHDISGGTQLYGSKSLVIKLSRKGIAKLASKGNFSDVFINTDTGSEIGNTAPDEKVFVQNLEKVSGFFSC